MRLVPPLICLSPEPTAGPIPERMHGTTILQDLILAVWLVSLPMVAIPQALTLLRIACGPAATRPVSYPPSAGRIIGD